VSCWRAYRLRNEHEQAVEHASQLQALERSIRTAKRVPRTDPQPEGTTWPELVAQALETK
jgi:hypothetical protein